MTGPEVGRKLRRFLTLRDEAVEKAYSVGAFKKLSRADADLAEFVVAHHQVILAALEKGEA